MTSTAAAAATPVDDSITIVRDPPPSDVGTGTGTMNSPRSSVVAMNRTPSPKTTATSESAGYP